MKKTLLITEEERKRISILHENAIKRQHLSEQVQYYKGKDGKVGVLNGPYDLSQQVPGATKIEKNEYDEAMKTQSTATDPNTTTTSTKTTTTTKGNPKVQEIQKKLIELGYGQMLGPKKDDGVLGKNTYNAILSALSSSPKLTTNMTPIQSKIESPSATAELKPSALNQPQKTPVNATAGGSGMGQAAAYDAKQAQVTAAQPAATGGNTPQVTNQVANKTKEQPKNTEDFDNEIDD